MLKISSNNKIYITKGDTGYIDCELCDDESFEIGDIVIFTVKEKLCDEHYIFQIKTVVEEVINKIQIKIFPEHTSNMNSRNYYYDIQVTRANGDINTPIAPENNEHNFFVELGVTD